MKWQQITPFLLHLQAVSIRTKIWGMVLGLVFILGAGITIQVRQAIRWTLEQQLGEQSVSIAHDVSARAADLILVNDLYALHQLLTETKTITLMSVMPLWLAHTSKFWLILLAMAFLLRSFPPTPFLPQPTTTPFI